MCSESNKNSTISLYKGRFKFLFGIFQLVIKEERFILTNLLIFSASPKVKGDPLVLGHSLRYEIFFHDKFSPFMEKLRIFLNLIFFKIFTCGEVFCC